jgi:hypothetical protein
LLKYVVRSGIRFPTFAIGWLHCGNARQLDDASLHRACPTRFRTENHHRVLLLAVAKIID